MTAQHLRMATSAPDSHQNQPNGPLAAATRTMSATRGRARQAMLVFDSSMIPMLLVDNDRRYVQANRAARLAFRMSLSEFLGKRIDDLTPEYQIPALIRAWRELHARGWVAGRYDIRFLDGSRLLADYCALANLLPGQHLIVFAPTGWPEDELGDLEDGSTQPLAGPLTPRELEVVSLVAAGADLNQIADELTISPATVRTHVGNAHRKLGARNRAHAVALALQQGLIDPTALAVRDRSNG